MSDSPAPRQERPRALAPEGRAEPPGAPQWIRPTVIFLLGLLLGTLVIAASRPAAGGWPSLSTEVTSSTANPLCDQVVTDSQHLAELAARAANAAHTQDSTTLTEVVHELNDSQRTLGDDAAECHR